MGEENVAGWVIGGAIEHGAFLMSLAAVALTALVILLAIAGVIAYVRVKYHARKTATKVAQKTAQEVAERAANIYLQTEMPAIMAAYDALGQDAVSDEEANRTAESQDDEQEEG